MAHAIQVRKRKRQPVERDMLELEVVVVVDMESAER